MFEKTSQAVKDAARSLMTERGTAGLTIRGIAAALELTPPAIYTYFASLEDLITALTTDGFNALADTLMTVGRDAEDAEPVARLLAVLLAYREWAIAHATDFQLIYGNPIPGYDAPREVTVPATKRVYVAVIEAMDAALNSTAYTPRAPYDMIPPAVDVHLDGMLLRDSYPVSKQAMYLTVIIWEHMHGLVSLEMFHHLQPVIGDAAQHYHAQILNLLRTFGFDI